MGILYYKQHRVWWFGGRKLENKIKHLEFIQSTITRMNQNSFWIKGWMITIVSALLAVPTFIFWLLDAYYLQQERKFRGVYNDVAGLTSDNDRIEIKDFEMPIYRYKCGKYCYFTVFLSKTIVPLYFVIIICLIVDYIMLD